MMKLFDSYEEFAYVAVCGSMLAFYLGMAIALLTL
jgi:hypothetical protein